MANTSNIRNGSVILHKNKRMKVINFHSKNRKKDIIDLEDALKKSILLKVVFF